MYMHILLTVHVHMYNYRLLAVRLIDRISYTMNTTILGDDIDIYIYELTDPLLTCVHSLTPPKALTPSRLDIMHGH